MMAGLQPNHNIINISGTHFYAETKLLYPVTPLLQQKSVCHDKFKVASLSESNSGSSGSGSALVQQRPPNSDEVLEVMVDQTADVESELNGSEIEYLAKDYGWKVRRMDESKSEMKMAADIQAHAFHVPGPFLDDFFFYIFQAEVLTGLIYRLRHSPPDRYACLVAMPTTEDDASSMSSQQHHQLVGVVDVTVLRDNDVIQQLEGAQEYVYVSGLAVSNNYRRRKVASVLLKACEVISYLWGQEYLVLRAYEDDSGARTLYNNAGYKLVSRDPIWVTWIGRKRRILMVKRLR